MNIPEGARATACPGCGWTYGTHSPDCPHQPPAWARGYSVPLLRAFAELFREHDKGFALGAFSGVRDSMVADWLHDNELFALDVQPHGPEPSVGAAVMISRSASTRSVLDFSGRVVTRLEPGTPVVKRVAGPRAHIAELIRINCAQRPALWELWQECVQDVQLAEALGFRWLGSKVRASSEIVGLWGFKLDGERPSPMEQAALVRLKLPKLNVQPLVAKLAELRPQFQQHYSSYNRGRSWTALALRGYGGRVDFIEKPAEMSKRWKAANDEKLFWTLEDTPLRYALREQAEPLIAAIPGKKHRIRLMALAPGGGELTRHADITDPDAGVARGMLLRIHIPLVTNDSVRFRQWLLDGRQKDAHMGVGECWFLDVRKPHTARNDGGCERIHLVMDVESCAELLELMT